MEEKCSGRKRKQCSDFNPFAGIFTRSKSQIYIHKNRSGNARIDSIRKQNHAQSLEKVLDTPKQPSIAPVTDVAQHMVKDLRSRRVFSPASMADEEGVEKFNLEMDLKSQILNVRNASSVEDLAVNSEIRSPINGDLNPSSEIVVNSSYIEEEPVVLHTAETNLNEKEIIGVSPDQCVQTTPPEQELDEIRVPGEKNGLILNRSGCGNDVDTAKASISKSRSALNSRVRRKVFKSPSSFSYRRLLPYLMDIAKDDSCSSKIEIVDVVVPCKVLKSGNMVPTLSSIRDCIVAGKVEEVGAEFDDRKPADNGGINNNKPCKEQKINNMSPNLVPTQESVGLPIVDKSQDDGLKDSLEECNQMTPPDADIFSNLKVNESLANIEDNILQNKDNILVNPSNGSVVRNGDGTVGNLSVQRSDSISISKLVLNPCSRMKLLKNPSFSHRRLLPFLMDIAKGASKVNKSSKLEKDLEQSPQPKTLTSLLKDIHVVECKTESFSGQYHGGDELNNIPTSVYILTDGSSDEMTSSSPNPRLASTNGTFDCNQASATLIGSTADHIPLDSQMDLESEFGDVKVGSSGKLEQVLFVNNSSGSHEADPSAVPLCSITDHEILPSELTIQSSQNCPVDTNNDHIRLTTNLSNDEGKPVISSMDHNLSQIEGFDAAGSHLEGLRKGILRRNPRGCRGLCNCLNCSSFRLHAERAFEFSRNQMQDSEELALELIKELADLRNILEKSAVDANYLAIVREKQMKEACMKALQAEELAKKQLEQMNADLSIHCRSISLQRPKVSFANSVEEKVIAKTGLCKR